MTKDEIRVKDHELEEQIEKLPIGSVVQKKVNGKQYEYHRWYKEGNRHEDYLTPDEAMALRAKVEKRKSLEAKRRELRREVPDPDPDESLSTVFATNVLTGESLRVLADSVREYRTRECFDTLQDYLYHGPSDKVLILYGLRRTGKTTLVRQALLNMSEEDLSRSAFIQVHPGNTLADVNQDLRLLERTGFRYVFLDEVTLMKDFIEGAALFSDVFAALGMRIVLSGTDSLGFLFTRDEQLYDRCILIHTTHIPYREFERVLGVHGIDEYIRYGGTMSLGGKNYNETATFANKESADEYVDSAIARNIQHSLRFYQYEGHFRHLQDLYENNELTSVINRVVEDINHRFTVEVLTRDFWSSDLAISAGNLRRDRTAPNDILDRVDVASVTKRLRELLEIRNKEEQSVEIQKVHAREIREYLKLLDLICEIDVETLPKVGERVTRTGISQPGLRYAQADALIQSLLSDPVFSDLSLLERNAVLSRIRSEVAGRMLEDIVLMETQAAYPKKQVFSLQFAVGEFDMVIFDPDRAQCEIFEIKHSREIAKQQYRHLVDEEKCKWTEHRYGPIKRRTVLYRGRNKTVDGIRYRNVEQYLLALK